MSLFLLALYKYSNVLLSIINWLMYSKTDTVEFLIRHCLGCGRGKYDVLKLPLDNRRVST